jgi:predicted Zn-dependent protease
MRCHEAAEAVLSASRAQHTMVIVTSAATVNTRWAGNELTTNGHTTTADATVIAVHEGPDGLQVGSLTRPVADLDPVEVSAAALASAQRAAPAGDAAPLVEGSRAVAPDWTGDAAGVSAADLAPVLGPLAAEIAEDAADGREHFGFLEFTRTSTWLATSSGVALRHDQPAARLELTVQSHNRSRSTWQGFAGTDPGAADVAGLAAQARTELSWQERSVSVPAQRRTALLSPSAVADLMVDLLWGADARAALEGRSAFSRPSGTTMLGERLADRPVRLFSDPRLPEAPGTPFVVAPMSDDATSVFDNGLPLDAADWVRDGRLTGLVAPRALAARTGLPALMAPDNLALDGMGTGSAADLVSRTDDGLLVTCTWYNRMVDPQTHLITGLTRDGVYLVRGGEVVGRAGNYRFNESPLGLLARIADASAAVPALGREMADYFPRTVMPALAVTDFNFSSASDAV